MASPTKQTPAEKRAADRQAAKNTTTTASRRTTLSRRAEAPVEEGPQYKVINSPTYLDQVLYPIGSTVTYFGQPGTTLVALNAEAKSRKIAVRDTRLDKDLSTEEKAEALRELSNEWNGVTRADPFSQSEGNLDSEDGLDEGKRDPALVAQALAGQPDANDAAVNPNAVKVVLQGRNEPDPDAKIGDSESMPKAKDLIGPK